MEQFIFFLNQCPEDFEVLQLVYFCLLIFKYIFIFVPIGLIIFVIIDLYKNVISGEEKEQKKNINLIIKRVIFAALLFFVPTIVNVLNGLLGNLGVNYVQYINCANKQDIQEVIVNKAEYLVEKATGSLDYNDFNDAKDVVSKIKDNNLRTNYENKLNSIEGSIKNNDGNSNRPQQDETTSTYHVSSITGIKYYLYNQNDPRWENVKYSGDITLGAEGCAVTSVAVVSSSYDSSITPLTIVNYSDWKLKTAHPSDSIPILTNNNFTCEHKTMYNKDVIAELKQGKVAVIYVGPESPFTSAHHYMALIDIKSDESQIFVGNAYSTGTGLYNRSAWYKTEEVFKGRSYLTYICNPSQSMRKK